ncbi:ALG6, ALG8 glycosyltransferase family-domain-containing protein [Cladochytrium replicatum]|nr:ALG6, ALG8 glycosyltransferase family-domain-containing protein [Cladochytrium replicatum]
MLPAVWLIVDSCNASLLVVLLQPALILIDHSHIHRCHVDRKQYANGSMFFCLSLCFIQMALCYALPNFFYLLGVCLSGASRRGALRGVYTLAKIGVTTIFTFAVMHAHLSRLSRRVFPIQRGLYEDKVANVWCSLSVVIKLRQLLDLNRLVVVSAVSTLLAVLPTSISLLQHRKIVTNTLLSALLNSSLALFLLSFQVHKKLILLPLMPSILLMVSDSDSKLAHRWFKNVAVFSMFPLLKRDGLVLGYWITLGYGMLCPSRNPDLSVVLDVLWSAGHFALLFVHFNVRQYGFSSAIDKSRDGSKKKEQ